MAFAALLVTACEGSNWGKDNAGALTQRDDWTPIEPSQLTGNLPEVLAGLPLRDAKRTLRNNSVQHDNVTITGRGWATAQRIVAPNSYFAEHISRASIHGSILKIGCGAGFRKRKRWSS